MALSREQEPPLVAACRPGALASPPCRAAAPPLRFRHLPPPYIVLGAHRSGTSLVAAMLSALGVYMGVPTETVLAQAEHATQGNGFRSGYGEAEAFYLANELLLHRAAAAWNRIEPFLARRTEPAFAAANVRLLRLAALGFLPRIFFRAAAGRATRAWGWKDPRNSVTAPEWLSLFPGARVIHVRREPAAVAESLHRRALSLAGENGPGTPPGGAPAALPADFRLLWALARPGDALRRLVRRATRRAGPSPGDPLPPPSDPCLERSHCERLARLYDEAALCAREHAFSFGGAWIEIRYEATLDDPLETARRLAAFCGEAASPAQLERAARLVRRERRQGARLW